IEVTIDKKKIHSEHPLRTICEHKVELRLHPEVTTNLKVRIDSATPLTPATPAPGAEPRGREREGAPARSRETAPARAKEAGKFRETAPAESKGERPAKKPKVEKKPE